MMISFSWVKSIERGVHILHVKDDLTKLGSLLFELRILLHHSIMAVRAMIECIDQLAILVPQPDNLRPQLVQVLLFPHTRPASRLSVGDHPSLFPLVDYALILRFVRSRVAAETTSRLQGAHEFLD
ncbi:uncharacterized protein [Henckelia pumila]|uniref:uncharacterized protein n=1 Tax=Henckelia pumila TaxID=405737 RepID=UPI003C6E1BDD